jgi:hypothetical protein
MATSPILFCLEDDPGCQDSDAILFWNCVALEVHRRDFTLPSDDEWADTIPMMDRQVRRGNMPPEMLMPDQGGPTRTSRALAMVHLAMYDA